MQFDDENPKTDSLADTGIILRLADLFAVASIVL